MPSLVDVANDSLAQIGESPINALDDITTKADIVNRHIGVVLPAMLQMARWNFNYRRRMLAADALTPEGSVFAYAFTLPGDSLIVYGIGDDPRLNGAPSYDAVWKVEQGKLLTDQPAPLKIHYGVLIIDPNQWGGGFTLAFSTLLASRLAGAITHDTQLSTSLYQRYQVEFQDALLTDAMEQSTDVYISPDLLEVRDI